MTIDDALLHSSERRLWHLIGERARTGADVARIDRRIWELFGETWAVVFTDLVGFSRRTQKFGITHFLQTIYEQRELLLPVIAEHDGFLVKAEADSYLLLFRNPTAALRCSLAMQRACQLESARRADEEKILLCVGIGYGNVLRVGTREVWGAEVNAASKLGEDTAQAHEVLLTSAAREAVGDLENVRFEPIDAPVPGADASYRAVYALSGG